MDKEIEILKEKIRLAQEYLELLERIEELGGDGREYIPCPYPDPCYPKIKINKAFEEWIRSL